MKTNRVRGAARNAPARNRASVAQGASVVLIHPAAARAANLRKSGLRSWQAGRLDEARELLSAAAIAAPRDASILCDLGSVLRLVGHSAEAMNCFMAALEASPGYRLAWLNAGSLAKETGDVNAAEAAFREALRLDPGCGMTAASLGLLFYDLNRQDEAISFLSAAIANGAATAPLYLCLGQLLVAGGMFEEALKLFSDAAHRFPADSVIAEQHASIGLVQAAVHQTPERALAVYRCLVKRDVDQKALLTAGRKAFLLLAGFECRDAAIALGEHLLTLDPSDLIIEHHLDALKNGRRDRAPAAYVVACFDRHAESFDKHLVEVLKYDVPAKMYRMLGEVCDGALNALDLGCGTGLIAPYLASLGGKITGVDLSPGMLAQARRRGLYDALIEADALEFLNSCDAQFDLVVAADMLPYLGALEPLFEALAARVAPGGLLAFSYETTRGGDYLLRPTGRFAHSGAYIRRLYERYFRVESSMMTTLRLEARRNVPGEIVVSRRLK